MIKVIYIMWLRQMKRYVRNPSRIVGSLGQPLLFLVGLGYGFGSVFRQAGEGDYLRFLTPGVVAQAVLFTAVFNGIELIWDRQFGFLKETLVAPVSRIFIMVGRVLGGATIAIIQGFLVMVFSLFVGFRPESFFAIPQALGVMFLIALLFTALGTAIASVMDDFHGFQMIMSFLVMPLFFLSGALFPTREVPGLMSIIIRANPLSYGVDALRGTLLGVSSFGIGLDLAVMVSVTVVFLAIGSYLFSRIQI